MNEQKENKKVKKQIAPKTILANYNAENECTFSSMYIASTDKISVMTVYEVLFGGAHSIEIVEINYVETLFGFDGEYGIYVIDEDKKEQYFNQYDLNNSYVFDKIATKDQAELEGFLFEDDKKTSISFHFRSSCNLPIYICYKQNDIEIR